MGLLLAPVAISLVPASASATNWLVNQADTYRVAQENGPGSINHTDSQWDVYGADLGHMFLYNTNMYMVFGDTFGGPAANPFFSVSHTDWRSNTIAAINPPTSPPTNGLFFNASVGSPPGMVTNYPYHAEQLLAPGAGDTTVIPTNGTSVGSRMYLYYQAVQQWGQPGHWTDNYSAIAYSDNGGHSWTKDLNASWPGNSNFAQVALVNQGGYIYVYGIPAGRYGSLELARVPTNKVLNTKAYQYWNGSTWVTGNPAAAVSIVPGPVGELSVQYNSYYNQWLMTYLVDPTGQIVMRTSNSPTGPWGPAQVVVTSAQYPQLYAPYMTPLWQNQKDIYFAMSMYGPYQVFLMHTSMTAGAPSGALPSNLQPAPISPQTTVPHTDYPYAHGNGSARAP